MEATARAVIVTTKPEIRSWISAAATLTVIPAVLLSFYVVDTVYTRNRQVNWFIFGLIGVGSLLGAFVLVRLACRRKSCTIDRNGLTCAQSMLWRKEQRSVDWGPLEVGVCRVALSHRGRRPLPGHYVCVAVRGPAGAWLSDAWTPDQAEEFLAALRGLDGENNGAVRVSLQNAALNVPRDCPRCGYELTQLHSRVCPECGPL
ncbi:MAG: hypothetical protein QM783_16995 [Phycisphaerales bacterium]